MPSRDRLVGWVCAGTALVLLALLLCIQGVPARIASEPLRVTVRFPHAAGLAAGEPVCVKGATLGSVEQVRYRDGGADVVLRMTQAVGLREDSRFCIRERSILGGKYVDVIPGAGPYTDRRTFTGARPVELLETAGEVLSLLSGDGPGAVVRDNLQDIRDALEEERGVLGRIARDDSGLRRDLAAISQGLLSAPKGLLHAAADDGAFAEAATYVERAFHALSDPDAPAGVLWAALTRDDSVEARQRQAIADAFAFISGAFERGEGSSRLFHMDAPLWERLAGIRETGSAFTAEGGGLAAYLMDPQGEARRTLAAIRGQVERLASRLDADGGGAVSRLRGDAYLLGALGLVFDFFTGGQGDRREQSPFARAVSLFRLISPP